MAGESHPSGLFDSMSLSFRRTTLPGNAGPYLSELDGWSGAVRARLPFDAPARLPFLSVDGAVAVTARNLAECPSREQARLGGLGPSSPCEPPAPLATAPRALSAGAKAYV